MPSRKPRVSPKKSEKPTKDTTWYLHDKRCLKYNTQKPMDNSCDTFCGYIPPREEAEANWSHAKDWNGPMTGKTTVSFNASCTCLSPSCKMEHPSRLDKSHISAWYPCPKCKTVDLYAKRQAFLSTVRTTLVEVAVTVIITSIWLAAVLVGVTAVSLSI